MATRETKEMARCNATPEPGKAAPLLAPEVPNSQHPSTAPSDSQGDERKGTQALLERQSAILRGINRIFREVVRSRSEEELGVTCLAVAEEITGSRLGFIGEIGEQGFLRCIALSDPGWEQCTMKDDQGRPRSPGNFLIHGLYGRVIKDGKGLIANMPRRHPDSVGIPEGHPPLTAFLGAPLVRDGRTIGIIVMGNREGGYRPEDLEALEALTPAVVEALQHRRAEEARRHALDHCQIALEAAHAATWEWDLRTDENSWSPQLWELYGVEPGSCTPSYEAWLAVVHPADRARAAQQVRKAAQEGSDFNLEFRTCHSNGEIRWLQAFGRPLRDSKGEPQRYVGIVLDISGRKRSEAALREAMTQVEQSRSQFEAVFQAVSDGIIVCDMEGFFVFANEAQARVLGYPGSAAMMKEYEYFTSIFELRYQDRQIVPVEEWPLSRVLRGESVVDVELHCKRCDTGQEWYLSFSGDPVRDKDGEQILAVVITRDVTGRNLAEEELRQAKKTAEAASRSKSRFLANMSHELRTPMTGVLGMIELVLGGALQADQREHLETADRCARSLLRILNDILDLTKVEAGKISLEQKPFPLEKCLQSVVDILLAKARRKGLRLTLQLPGHLPERVVGDQVRLKQVLTNLLANAVKFTEAGTVELGVSAGAPLRDGRTEFTFTVTDTGIGIPEDKSELIFNSFSQADDSNTRVYGGTGLGLTICKELVERMGGTIWFTSSAGKGSTFSFTVPLGGSCTATTEDAEGGTLPPEGQEELQGGKGANRRILVVEDDPVVRQLLATMLGRYHFQLELAEDGEQALELWGGNDYDVVLMDIQMPRMDGFAATKLIREREEQEGRPHTMVVAMTAHASLEDEGRCLAAGMDAYLSKPIDFKRSIEVIRELMEKRESSPPLPPSTPPLPSPPP